MPGFVLLTFLLTWCCFITVAVARIPAASPAGYALILLGAFAPAIVAVTMTASRSGRAGVVRLIERVDPHGVPPGWFALAASYMVLVKLTVALLHRGLIGSWPAFGGKSPLFVAIAIAMSTPFQVGEELGWRGYALQRLASSMGLRRASVLLGLIWAAWHLPQFYIMDADTYHQSFPVFTLQVVALSIALAWIYARTGSLLPAMLLHAGVNNGKDIVPSAAIGAAHPFTWHASTVGWLTVAVLWMAAGYCLLRMPASLVPQRGRDG